MTVLGSNYLSLADWAKRQDPDGKIGDIAELLSQTNEIFEDMVWLEGNLPTGHRSTVRTGLPSGTWRQLYQGVVPGKSTTAQIEDHCGSLEAYSIVDRNLAELNGDIGKFRLSEDMAQMEGLSQQVATALFYGNAAVNQTQFTGLSPRFNTVATASAQTAYNVIDCGGTASSNTSIWIVGWGDRTCHGIFPKGSKAGLLHEDKGDTIPGYDGSYNRFEAYTSYFRWQAGLTVRDWRYVVRLANVDVTSATLGLQNTTPVDLYAQLAKAVIRMPTTSYEVSGITKSDAPDGVMPAIRPVIYCNRTVRQYLDIQAMRNARTLLRLSEYAGKVVADFRGIPIRVCDALVNTETRVV